MVYSVITGDIIQSSHLDAEIRQWLMEAIKKTMLGWHKEFEMESELVRGDSFQCLTRKPNLALTIALLIRTFVKSLNPNSTQDIYQCPKPILRHAAQLSSPSFDLRMAIGVGTIDYEGATLAESDGEAFQLSGKALDALKESRSHFNIVSHDGYAKELASMAVLLDAIVSKTTALQCEVIHLKLLGQTETQIASLLKIHQSAVNQRAHAGSWHAIRSGINRFNEIYGEP